MSVNGSHFYYHQMEFLVPTVTATTTTTAKCPVTKEISKFKLQLCLTVLLMWSFLTVQCVSCKQLMSISNTTRHNHKRLIQHDSIGGNTEEHNNNLKSQQQELQQEEQQLHYIPNIVVMENSFKHNHKENSHYFNKYRLINNNQINSNRSNIRQNSHNSSQSAIFSNNTQILIVFNETLHSRHINLKNKYKNNNVDINKHLYLNIVNKSYMLGKNSSYNNKENNSKELMSESYYAVANDFVEQDPDVIYVLDQAPNQFTNNIDNQKLLELVMDGLGMQNLPDMKKVNISQQEYVTKYKEYVQRVNARKKRELSSISDPMDQLHWEEENAPLHMLSIVHNSTEWQRHFRHRRDVQTRAAAFTHGKAHHQNDKTSVILQFPLDLNATQLQANDIEEANIKLMLITSPSLAVKRRGGNGRNKQRKGVQRGPTNTQPQKHVINIKVYQLLEKGRRRWLDGRKIVIELDRTKVDDSHSHWLEFDVTKAVEGWLSNRQSNLGLEVKCENCYRHGARIIDDLSMEMQQNNGIEASGRENNADEEDDEDISKDARKQPVLVDNDKFNLTPVLNIIGRLGTTYHEHRSRQRSSEASQHHHTAMRGSGSKASRKTNCYKDNQRCCRHPMQVVFKEIKGFEFIIQPKVFDAGYCRGRCPPRYNPAHHHAMLQSLIWKQDRTRVPRPCCAPSKLVELEVLHVDEKDSDKLKISTWTDMRVLECACS